MAVLLEGRPAAQPAANPAPNYIGSTACRTCHPAIYERWKKTRMANVVRDPGAVPQAILPDLSKPDPLVTFGLQDIALVDGSKWKQRYFARVGDDNTIGCRRNGTSMQN